MNRIPVPPSFALLRDRLALLFATGFFVSYLPAYLAASLPSKDTSDMLKEKKWTGAGLFGSLFGAFTYLIMPAAFANSLIVLLLATVASVYIAGRAEKLLNSHDDPRIVIDEWIGVWIALWGWGQVISIPFIAAVVLFRFFDVWKGPWGHAAQRLPGGWGVAMDDILAGIAANLVTRFVFAWLPAIIDGAPVF